MGVGVDVASVVIALSMATGPADVTSCVVEESLLTSLTVMTALRAVVALAVVAAEALFEPLDVLPVPLSEIVMESRAPASVKSACTVWAMVPLVAVEVR